MECGGKRSRFSYEFQGGRSKAASRFACRRTPQVTALPTVFNPTLKNPVPADREGKRSAQLLAMGVLPVSLLLGGIWKLCFGLYHGPAIRSSGEHLNFCAPLCSGAATLVPHGGRGIDQERAKRSKTSHCNPVRLHQQR